MTEGFKYAILASGSTGNATYIETDTHKILVDAGFTGKKLGELMDSIGRSLSDVDTLLLTHEHSDHIKGAGVLARKYPQLQIYANVDTWDVMMTRELIGKVPEEQRHIFEMGKTLTFGDIDVESFGVSHDAVAPQFYKFMKDDKSFVILTDTGYVSDRMEGVIENADAYIMESNHDVEMLRVNEWYTWRTKQRILSDRGHLSNEDGALAALDVIGNKTKHIFLGHRSQHNNLRELAHLTMETELQLHDVDTRTVQVHDTSHEIASPLFDI
ncbi:MAG: MBL fold metallo-hydrolase [Streptococcaceae bacterium]|jgi:ribonuclease Z|nr:MBL fold metallo-hydrolase [Streptococcaceae bacterium]